MDCSGARERIWRAEELIGAASKKAQVVRSRSLPELLS
jgi:hypothetical protein